MNTTKRKYLTCGVCGGKMKTTGEIEEHQNKHIAEFEREHGRAPEDYAEVRERGGDQ